MFDYLGGDDCVLEREPLERLASEGQLMAYRHEGFFFAMDTYREYQHLNELWASGKAPWKVMEVTHHLLARPADPGHRRHRAWSAAGWCKRLLAAGADVVCLVRDWVPQSELVRSRNCSSGSRSSAATCATRRSWSARWASTRVDTVFHLAAQTIVGIANRNPVSTFETNIRGTWTLLEACRRSPAVRQIVVASSDKAYGDQAKLPYDETRAAAGPASLRRQQVLRRPDRPAPTPSPTVCRWPSRAAATSTAAAT